MHDPDRYYDCMAEIKRRIAILDDALIVYRRTGEMAVPNLELACLQLRKVYELVGFASLAANKTRYADIRARFERDWNLGEILKVIESFNPNFLPIAFKEVPDPNPDIQWQIVKSAELKFTRQRLARAHGTLGSILHANNPYRPEINYQLWFNQCVDQRDRILKILSNHTTEIIKDEVFYRVVMHFLPAGKIDVSVMVALDKAEAA